jgi:magnesium chelatase family protein
MTPEATRLVDDRLWSGKLTRRGVTRVHRLAWTVADLADVDRPGVAEAEVALRLRNGDPLLAATLRRVG